MDLAVWGSLSCITDMISHNRLAGIFRSLGVGHSYEVICLGDNGFYYIDNLFHLRITVDFDENALVRHIELENIMYKYFMFHDHAVVLTMDNSKRHFDATIATPPGIVDADILEQVSDILLKSLEAKNADYARSDYYCCSIIARSPDYHGNLPPIIIPKDAPKTYPFKVEFSNTEINFGFSTAGLTRKYRAFRLSLYNPGTYKNFLPYNQKHNEED